MGSDLGYGERLEGVRQGQGDCGWSRRGWDLVLPGTWDRDQGERGDGRRWGRPGLVTDPWWRGGLSGDGWTVGEGWGRPWDGSVAGGGPC